jgi:hypothetical protein
MLCFFSVYELFNETITRRCPQILAATRVFVGYIFKIKRIIQDDAAHAAHTHYTLTIHTTHYMRHTTHSHTTLAYIHACIHTWDEP